MEQNNLINILPQNSSLKNLILTNKLKTIFEEYIINSDQINRTYNLVGTENFYIRLILGIEEEEKDLPLFNAPIFLEILNNKKYLLSDLRHYLGRVNKYIDPNDVVKIEDVINNEYYKGFELPRLIFTKIALDEGLESLSSLNKLSEIIYSDWITNSLSASILNLNIDDKLRTKIVCIAFYKTISSYKDFDESSKHVLINKLANNLRANNKFVTDVINRIDLKGRDVATLVNNLKSVLPEKGSLINQHILYNSINKTWYGPSHQINLPLAIENIPTWLAIVYSTFEIKHIKKYILGEIVNFNRNNNLKKSFLTQAKQIINENYIE